MADLNDRVLPETAFDFGDKKQIVSGVLGSTLTPTADVELFRRVLRSSKNVIATLALSNTLTFQFQCPSTEARRWIFARLQNNTAVKVIVNGLVQRGNSAELNQEAVRAEVDIGDSIVIIGSYARNGLTVGDMLSLPDFVVQPSDSEFTFKITEPGGGAFGVGSLTLETSWFREPPLRRWGGGPPDVTLLV